MMYILLPVILFSIYIGNVLGCLLLCETIPELSKAKKYVWQVPIVNFRFIISTLFSPEFRLLKLYLSTPCKNVIGTYAVGEAAKRVAAERKKSNKHRSNSQNARRVFRDSVEGCSRAVSESYYI